MCPLGYGGGTGGFSGSLGTVTGASGDNPEAVLDAAIGQLADSNPGTAH